MARLVPLRQFWRGLCTNRVGTAGVVLTTSAFVLFVGAEALRMLGAVTNAYVGLLTYLALPAVFVLGLVLIPIGWRLYRRRTGKSTTELLSERFDPEHVAPGRGGARVVQTIAIFTLVNVLFLGVGGARMLHFMDQPRFCGTACHSVMHPEWVAYQDSPHARVACVECHVGEGAGAAVDAKLNGMWQMISVTFDLYERPIPTPVHQLRPARQTCERCHWPDAFYGDRIKRIVHYADDRASTPRYSTLSLKVGSGTGEQRGQIHWHVAARNEVRYMPHDRTRMAVRWVEVRQPDGSYKRYDNRRLADGPAPGGAEAPRRRVLDCVDCHNRATHIYEAADEAVDRRIAAGEIDRRLPFARRQALAALTGSYARRDRETALRGIDADLRGYYRRHHPQVLIRRSRAVDRAVRSLQRTWERNIFPRMNVWWGSYPDHLGHERGPGCRRCHSPDMVDSEGRAVAHECTLCHSLLSYEGQHPFQNLLPPRPGSRECALQVQLGREFLGAGHPAGTDPCAVDDSGAP